MASLDPIERRPVLKLILEHSLVAKSLAVAEPETITAERWIDIANGDLRQRGVAEQVDAELVCRVSLAVVGVRKHARKSDLLRPGQGRLQDDRVADRFHLASSVEILTETEQGIRRSEGIRAGVGLDVILRR